MKKIITSIISMIFLITISLSNVAASNNGYIDNLLDLDAGIEEYDIELAYIDDIYFYNSTTQAIFENFKQVNRLLKDEIIKKYRDGEFDYYQIKGIIKNQKNFVFHVNKLFYYLSIKESNPEYVDVDALILKNYSNARISYNRVKDLVY